MGRIQSAIVRVFTAVSFVLAASSFVGCGDTKSGSTDVPSRHTFTGTTANLGCPSSSIGASTARSELNSRPGARIRIPIDDGELVIEYSRANLRPQMVNGVKLYGRKAPVYVTNGREVRLRVDESMDGAAALMYVPSSRRNPTVADNIRFKACTVGEDAPDGDFTGWPGAIYTKDPTSCVRLIVGDGRHIQTHTLAFGRRSCN
jgi:hypothetical protein